MKKNILLFLLICCTFLISSCKTTIDEKINILKESELEVLLDIPEEAGYSTFIVINPHGELFMASVGSEGNMKLKRMEQFHYTKYHPYVEPPEQKIPKTKIDSIK